MKKFLSIFLIILFMLNFSACGEKSGEDEPWYSLKTEFKTDGQLYTESQVSLPNQLWQTPESERYDVWDVGCAKGYFIKSVQETWAFCLVGIPEGASEENKVPGIVLVHGGGGTAYQQWVNFWVNRGYAAIAIDTEGTIPNEKTYMNNANRSLSPKTPRGPLNGGYDDIEKPIEEQWSYHGIAATIVANSFLRSFEGVDKNKIGITGISYGSYLCWQTIAYDDRFVFAAPVYGSPYQQGKDTSWGTVMMIGKVAEYWDDANGLKYNNTPILFFNSNIDKAFSIEATTESVQKIPNSYMILRNGFLHGHDLGGLEVDEVYAFADSICKNESGLIKFITQPDGSDFPSVEISVPKGVKVESVFAFYTESETLNSDTKWNFVLGDFGDSAVSASIPGNAKYYYINVIDERGLEVSSCVVEFNG